MRTSERYFLWFAALCAAGLLYWKVLQVFHAYDNWEDSDRLEVIRQMFQQPGLRRYRFFEVPLNSQIFHLDISPVGGYGPQQRFIFDKVEDIFDFCLCEKISDFRIHVQTRRDGRGNFQLKRIVKILEGAVAEGGFARIFVAADGSVEKDDFLEVSGEDIVAPRCVWSEAKEFDPGF
ncbi:hypothetical protein [Massilia sp. YIM B02763]|uniref:hypothetical protein n=1 Tax=Massilia sp. YIM B02763 TaxID=3050130 RepID=UPI0025B6CDB8|nr:hypothetical protein [Massilia sp. YIM B02763]